MNSISFSTIFHLLHDQGVHDIEDIPGDPHGAVLYQERSPLETQGQTGPTVGQQVKPGEMERDEER